MVPDDLLWAQEPDGPSCWDRTTFSSRKSKLQIYVGRFVRPAPRTGSFAELVGRIYYVVLGRQGYYDPTHGGTWPSFTADRKIAEWGNGAPNLEANPDALTAMSILEALIEGHNPDG